MSWGAIASMGYVAMQSTDVDRAVAHAEQILGLTQTGRSGNAAFLSSAARMHHELVYVDAPADAVGQFGLAASGPEGLASIRARVREAGFPIVAETPLVPGVAEAFSFVGPNGFVWEIYTRMAPAEISVAPHRPERYGHINVHVRNARAFTQFLVDILDFKICDAIGDGFGYFVRCNTEHHGIAVIEGPVDKLHHHAWQVQSIVQLGQLGDRLWESGSRLLVGPVRHGETGRNIAAYYVEPTGNVIELYADMRHIYDDDAPINYMSADSTDWYTEWATYDTAEFRSHGAVPGREAIASS